MRLTKLALCVATATLTAVMGVAFTVAVRAVTSSSAIEGPVAGTVDTPPIPESPVAPGVVVGLSPDDAENESAEITFNPTGDYYTDPKKIAKPFADVSHIEIQTRIDTDEEGYYIDLAIPPTGSINTTAKLKFTRIAIANREIAFQTATVNGISYRFTGRFFSEPYCEIYGDKSDLRGKLIKIKNGKWAAETDAEFYLVCGC